MKTMTDIQGRVYNVEIRDYVMERMHYDAPQRGHKPMSQARWICAYLMANGFGEITLEQAQEQCWDWSHVRDSSPEAIERIAKFLGYQVAAKIA